MRTMAVHSPSALLTCTLRLCNGHFVLLILWVLRATNVKYAGWGSIPDVSYRPLSWVYAQSSLFQCIFRRRFLCGFILTVSRFDLFRIFGICGSESFISYTTHVNDEKGDKGDYTEAVKYQSNTSFFSCLKLKLRWIMASKFFFRGFIFAYRKIRQISCEDFLHIYEKIRSLRN